MATVFPRAVVWDPTRGHHLTVLVDRKLKIITVNCWECEKGYELYLCDLEWAKQMAMRDEDVQIVAWVERFSHEC